MAQHHEGRVLVVHDNPSFTAHITKAFNALGFIADVAIDCTAALRQIEQAPPDVVCVNLNLPRDSGYHLCELVRSNPDLDHVKILIISDRDSPDVVAYAEEAGANAFLKQPFKPALLASYVTTMLEMSGGPSPGELRRPVAEHLTLE